MRCVKSIKLIFENCESCTVERKYIGQFSLDNIKYSIVRGAINSIGERYIIGDFAIELSKTLNDIKYHPFGIEDEEVSIFSRLTTYNDITGIEVLFTDGTDEYYLLNWCDENEYCNSYQKNYISELGNLYIVVSKTNDIDYYFDKEIVDNYGTDFSIIEQIEAIENGKEETDNQ